MQDFKNVSSPVYLSTKKFESFYNLIKEFTQTTSDGLQSTFIQVYNLYYIHIQEQRLDTTKYPSKYLDLLYKLGSSIPYEKKKSNFFKNDFYEGNYKSVSPTEALKEYIEDELLEVKEFQRITLKSDEVLTVKNQLETQSCNDRIKFTFIDSFEDEEIRVGEIEKIYHVIEKNGKTYNLFLVKPYTKIYTILDTKLNFVMDQFETNSVLNTI